MAAGPGLQVGEVLRGAALGAGDEAEVAEDLGDEFGEGAGGEVLVGLGSVQAVQEFRVQRGFAAGGGWVGVEHVLDAADEAAAGLRGVGGAGGDLGGPDRGEVLGEADGAADGSGDAVEGDGGVLDGEGARLAGLVGGGLGGLVDLGGEVLAHGDEGVEGFAVEGGVLVLLGVGEVVMGVEDYFPNPGSRARSRGVAAQRLGVAAEAVAEGVLVGEGWVVLGRRLRFGRGTGEIDLVVEREGVVVFVEVKARGSLGEAAYAVSEKQRGRVMAGAAAALAANPGWGVAGVRFDVMLVDAEGRVRRVVDAFREG